jgi:hypothetical protein
MKPANSVQIETNALPARSFLVFFMSDTPARTIIGCGRDAAIQVVCETADNPPAVSVLD